MKLATFNIQNLFHRHKDLNKIPLGKCALLWINEMDTLIRKRGKDPIDIDRIKELSFLIGFDKRDRNTYAIMRKRGGELYFQGRPSATEMKANLITDWKGWAEIKTLPLDPVSIQNKARVIAEVNPDILLLQEVEDRSSLVQFNKELLPSFNGVPFREVVVLQGNDERGQEMALMTKNGYYIRGLETFADEFEQGVKPLFDKNLLKYKIITPSGNIVYVILVHLQEALDTDKDLTDNKRYVQASRVADICNQLSKEGQKNIVVAGTFNAVSYCYSLSPLLQYTDLKDVSKHRTFEVAIDDGEDAGYYRMGAYKKGVNIKQLDYLLLSPALFNKVKKSGLNRRAVWPKVRPQWSIYNTIQKAENAASEHPVVFVELDI